MQLIKTIKHLNPEQNTTTRAILYAIGAWGVIHISIMAILSVYKGDIRELNTLIAINADKFIPSIKTSYVMFVVSWIGLVGTVIAIKKLISKN